jgi:predicted dehydrogenase
MPVHLGFLGAGLVARIHQQSLSAVADHVVWAGVYDPDVARAMRFSAETGATVCRTEDELLERSEAVYICTWTSEHPRLVGAAADRRLSVYCEKPLAVSLADAEAMTEQVTRAGVVNQAGLVLRHSPAFRWVRWLVDDPRSGRLMSVSFRDDQYLPVRGYYDSTWRADAARAGSGVLLEHSIHDVDILEFLAGPIAQVSCRTAFTHRIQGIEDVASAAFTFASGVPGTLTTVWHDILERPNERRVEIFCENLWCVLDGNHHWGPVFWRWGGEPVREAGGEKLLPLLDSDAVENSNPDAGFIASIEAGRPAHPDFRIARRAHQIVDAAYRSAEADGTPIDALDSRPSAEQAERQQFRRQQTED